MGPRMRGCVVAVFCLGWLPTGETIGLHSALPSVHPHLRPLALLLPSLRQRSASIRLAGTPSSLPESSATTPPAEPLPAALLPVSLMVFSQLLGEGIAISSLPLYLTSRGAAPLQAGLATSCFSAAQMVCCPLLVQLSNRIGRAPVLSGCLLGATSSCLLIALSQTTRQVIIARMLAGVFAASVPVAQSAITDLVSKNQTALALSRVSAASQSGVVLGPLVSAGCQAGFGLLGVPAAKRLPATFVLSASFALAVLLTSRRALGDIANDEARRSAARRERKAAEAGDAAAVSAVEDERAAAAAALADLKTRSLLQRLPTQVLLRATALIVGWSLTLSVFCYGLFAAQLKGWGQVELSATYSAGAALAVAAQFVLPRIVRRFGEHLACSLGVLGVAAGLVGLSTVLTQPFHSLFYLLARVGGGVSDTATATLVARTSRGKTARSRNLALISSTRAGARIVTPLISARLFYLSTGWRIAPGALPYFACALCAVAVSPLPLVLRAAERERREADIEES